MNKFSKLFLILPLCLIVIFGFYASNGFCENIFEDFHKSAEQGDAEAQFFLGTAYYSVQGVLQDASESVKLFRKAAEQGHAEAQLQLGRAYLMADGVSKDSAEAVKWYRKAAEQRLEDAAYYLGMIYAYGTGVPKDEIEGLAWFNISAAFGEQLSVRSRNKLEKELGPQASLQAQQRGKEILKEIESARQKRLKTEEPGQ